MDHIVEPTEEVVDVPDEIQIADAVAMFNEALEKSEHDWEAAEELFEKSFDGMVELARTGDTTAQHNVARMYGMGINEPYDEDIDLLNKWLWEAEEDLQVFLKDVQKRIDEMEIIQEEIHNEGSNEPGARHGVVDHDKEARKLRRLYLLKERLEKMGIRTGANEDEYKAEPDND